jgi:hypothetical protein
MKRITKFSPDTCSCIIYYEWDDALPEDLRTHTVVASGPDGGGYVCPEHASLGTPQVAHGLTITENQTKNQACSEVVKQDPAINIEEIGFSYDTTRILTLKLPSTNLKGKISQSLDKLFGKGKIKVI